MKPIDFTDYLIKKRNQKKQVHNNIDTIKQELLEDVKMIRNDNLSKDSAWRILYNLNKLDEYPHKYPKLLIDQIKLIAIKIIRSQK